MDWHRSYLSSVALIATEAASLAWASVLECHSSGLAKRLPVSSKPIRS